MGEKFEELLGYSGYHTTPVQRSLGIVFIFSLVFSVISLVVVFLLTGIGLYTIISPVVGFAVAYGSPFIYLSMVSNKRASEVDQILPDALQLMAANVRAGMTTERAIWLSARPEFGPLEDEIHRVSSKVMGGEPLTRTLEEMEKNINSELLGRAVKLMNEGIRSGGEMATLLEETANDIRTAQNIRERVRANVTMYSMFIIFASVLGAPLLYALSVYFIEVTSTLWVEEMVAADMGEMGGGMMSMEGPDVEASTLKSFSIAAITITTAFGGMIIGLIQKGKSLSGLKYSPFMIAAALLVFFVANILVTSLFGGIVGL